MRVFLTVVDGRAGDVDDLETGLDVIPRVGELVSLDRPEHRGVEFTVVKVVHLPLGGVRSEEPHVRVELRLD
jgi:hypothetical protein